MCADADFRPDGALERDCGFREGTGGLAGLWTTLNPLPLTLSLSLGEKGNGIQH